MELEFLGGEATGSSGIQPIQELDGDLVLRMLNYSKVYEDGVVVKVFLDGTEIEYKAE